MSNTIEVDRLRGERYVELLDLPDKVLGSWKWKMYEEGIWTGYLNALSTRADCTPNISDVEECYRDALNYLSNFYGKYVYLGKVPVKQYMRESFGIDCNPEDD